MLPDGFSSEVAVAVLDAQGALVSVETSPRFDGHVMPFSFLHRLGMTPDLCKSLVDSASAAGRITNIRGRWHNGPRGHVPVILELQPQGPPSNQVQVRVMAAHDGGRGQNGGPSGWPTDMVQATNLLQIGLLRCMQRAGVWRVDWMNRGAADLLGLMRTAADGMLPIARWMEQLSASSRQLGTPVVTVAYERPDERMRRLELALAMVDSGGLPAAAIMIRDVTAAWEAQSRLEATMTALAESNDRLQTVASGLAHDLRSPVLTAGTLLDLLLKKVGKHLDPKGEEVAGVLRNVVGRMDDMIQGLVAYSSVGNAYAQNEVADAADAVHDVQDALSSQIHAAGARLVCEGLPHVVGSRVGFTRVVQNLVENALRYRGDAPLLITIQAKPAGGMARFRVRDNGKGFDPDMAGPIFDPYRRLDDAGDGLGMGLALCRRIVETHGGEMWAKGVPDVGATFYFTWPVARVDDTLKEEMQAS